MYLKWAVNTYVVTLTFLKTKMKEKAEKLTSQAVCLYNLCTLTAVTGANTGLKK